MEEWGQKQGAGRTRTVTDIKAHGGTRRGNPRPARRIHRLPERSGGEKSVIAHLQYIRRNDGGSHSFYGALNESTAIDQRKDSDKMSKQELIEELKRIERATPQDVIYEKKPPRNAEHPTMKPVEILARFIKNSTKSEDIVLDPFGGSGSTLIAAAKTGRTARLCEIDPHYCDVIRKRWTAWAKENGYAVGTGGLE